MNRTVDAASRLAAGSRWDGDCLIFDRGYSVRSGHTLISYLGRQVGVHRVAWELARGPVPAGLLVCHHCDVPRCINPRHLYLGTVADNNNDRDNRGRHVALRGSDNGFAKLDENDVLIIKALLMQGAAQARLAEGFGVRQSTIQHIASGETWRHVSLWPTVARTS